MNLLVRNQMTLTSFFLAEKHSRTDLYLATFDRGKLHIANANCDF
jgi:hypothetical protein